MEVPNLGMVKLKVDHSISGVDSWMDRFGGTQPEYLGCCPFPKQYVEKISNADFVRTVIADSAVPVGLAHVFEGFELVVKKRVEPVKEVAPVLKKKTSTPQSSMANKGKGIKPNVSIKKKKSVPSMRAERNCNGLLLHSRHPHLY